MKKYRKWISVALLALTAMAVALAAGSLRAGETVAFDPSPRSGVLLLENGETIQGKVTRTGDYYHVVVPNGEIRVRAVDVEFACTTFEEGYQRKRSFIRLGTVREYLELAEWCQRHGLDDYARKELDQAEAVDPRHPMIAVLRRRMEIAATAPAEPRRLAEEADAQLAPAELDRLVRTLPAGTVEVFTQTIQPLLMNNCTTSGCHASPEAGKYRLLRASSSRPPGRRLTQRNLHATLEFVDREKPDASPLLTTPIRPHGTAKTAIFTTVQANQYARLVGWVQRLKQGAVAAPAKIETPAQHFAGALPTPAATMMASGGAANRRETDEADDSAAEEKVVADEPVDEYGLPSRQRPLQRGNPLPGFVPDDPFDPEIFNRRYCPPKPAAEAEAAPVVPAEGEDG